MKIILLISISFICVVSNSQTIDVNQIIHPKENEFKNIVHQDSTLQAVYGQGIQYVKNIVEQKITEGLLRHSVVSSSNFPKLYKDALEITKRLGLGEPKHIFIKQEREIGASTIVADSNNYVMFIHSGVFNVMTRKERKILLAHELTHAKLEHSRYAVMIKILQKTNEEKLNQLLETIGFGVIQIFRYFEYSADRGAYLATKIKEKHFLSTIMRFASGVPLSDAKQSIDGYEDQIEEFIELNLSTSDIEKFYAEMPERKQDNPFPILKAIEIKKFIAEINN